MIILKMSLTAALYSAKNIIKKKFLNLENAIP